MQEATTSQYIEVGKTKPYEISFKERSKPYNYTLHMEWNGTNFRFLWKRADGLYNPNIKVGIPFNELAALLSRVYKKPFNLVDEKEILRLRKQLDNFQKGLKFGS